jgi:SagB-type dehydrogenase family enzyme
MDRQSDIGASDRFDRGLFSVSEIFHENTKMRRAREGWLVVSQGLQPLPSELHYAMTHAFKTYRSAMKLLLPKGLPPLAEPFEHVLRTRRSIREYSGAAVSLEYLSRILELSCGVTGETLLDDGVTWLKKRAAPSAGALYTIETYLIALRVAGLEGGLYHYQPADHSLECLRVGDLRGDIESAVLYPEVVAQASAVFLHAAVFQRTRFKYGERGYRFALLDAGHVAQNIYLVATALELGAVAIGGFLDDELNQMLEMNGVDEAIVYVMVVGHPAETNHLTSRHSE